MSKRPEYLKIKMNISKNYLEVKEVVESKSLHTVCKEARCPNIYECWSNRTATFMILGNICTRACRFCAVKSGMPTEVDFMEPLKVAEAVLSMGIKYAVVTSVARDDLEDGGAFIFAKTIKEIRRLNPFTKVEVLIPDFSGNFSSLKKVIDACPDVLNHNIETVRRLSDRVRAKAKYTRSLEVLQKSKDFNSAIPTKSSIMVGLGESFEEVIQTMKDLKNAKVDIVTIGQYLQPTKKHLPIKKYYTPLDFEKLKKIGLELGFSHVESGPLVRSSYCAHNQLKQACKTFLENT